MNKACRKLYTTSAYYSTLLACTNYCSKFTFICYSSFEVYFDCSKLFQMPLTFEVYLHNNGLILRDSCILLIVHGLLSWLRCFTNSSKCVFQVFIILRTKRACFVYSLFCIDRVGRFDLRTGYSVRRVLR